MNLTRFLKSFLPHHAHISIAEKIRSGIAGGIAILLLTLALHHLPQHDYPMLLLASMAASAVLLYAAPHSPFSQPWNLVGGHCVSALAGWLCSLLITDPTAAGGTAVGAAIFLMYVLKCLHPPGAATALMMVLSSTQFHAMGWQWIAWVVFANAMLSLLLALLINNIIPGRRYPMPAAAPSQAKLDPVIVPTQDDIEWALTQMDSTIDVSTEDLTDIYAKALAHARSRYDSAIK